MAELKVCGRCSGTGRYSYNQIDGSVCYGCSGTGNAGGKRPPEAKVKKTIDIVCKEAFQRRFASSSGAAWTVQYKVGDAFRARYGMKSKRTGKHIYWVGDYQMNLDMIEQYFEVKG